MEDESRFAEQAVFPSSLDIPCWILDISPFPFPFPCSKRAIAVLKGAIMPEKTSYFFSDWG